jgi:hypothetical protein
MLPICIAKNFACAALARSFVVAFGRPGTARHGRPFFSRLKTTVLSKIPGISERLASEMDPACEFVFLQRVLYCPAQKMATNNVFLANSGFNMLPFVVRTLESPVSPHNSLRRCHAQ